MVGRGFFTILVSVIFAPIFEEILCRGIILESFRAKYGIWAAWLCSSLFFGVIHGEVAALFSASVLGLILGYAYIRTNSIFSAIILHALNNGLALALIAFNLDDSTFRELITNPQTYWTVWAAALLIVIIGAIIMVRNLQKVLTQKK
jgi:membrane protease YdiL (CAAX protease family)